MHAFALALLLFIAACSGDDSTSVVNGPGPTPVTPPTTAEVLAAGEHGVGVTTLTLFDTTRSTLPNSGVPTPSRRLVTEVWYPAAPNPSAPATGERNAALDSSGAKYPLVVYSHGFADQRGGCGYIGRHLASHGYIVAAPDFPLTNFNAQGGLNGADLVNQPGDVSFIIDSLLDGVPDARFAAAIDEDRIGIAGLSFGGLTTSLAAYHPELRDPRVKAAASVAGIGCIFNDVYYSNADVPFLFLHGTLDGIVPYAANAEFGFGEARAPKYLVTLADGTHTPFTEVAAVLFDPLDNADELGCSFLGGAGSGSGVEEEDDGPFGLGGEEIGIIDGICPDSCEGPFPRAMRPPRQRDIARLALFPFFEAHLRGRAEMREYLRRVLEEENADVTVESE